MMEWNLNTPSGCCQIWMEDHASEALNLERLLTHAQGRRLIWVSDERVWAAHSARLPGQDVLLLEGGETHKTLFAVEQLYGAFLKREVDKSCLIVALGGGITTDIAGYAASTFKRGIPFAFMPSSLLAMVDAALGGKNGVNLAGFKNMVGVIRQPEFVHVAPELLKTLPTEEFRFGLAEVVKAACIQDAVFFDFLEHSSCSILEGQDSALRAMIRQAVTIKANIVQADDQEKGLRMLLNFGHTLGHALEKCLKIPHGQAVAMGCVAASKLSVQQGLLKPDDLERIKGLFARFRLPTDIPKNALLDGLDILRQDKKRHGHSIRWVLLEGLGHGVLQDLSMDESAKALKELGS